MSPIQDLIYQIKNFSDITPTKIVHIGGSDGQGLLKMCQVFGSPSLHSFEPNPYWHNNEPYQRGYVNLHKKVVSGKSGEVVLNVPIGYGDVDTNGCASIYERKDEWGKSLRYRPLKVESVTIEEVFRTCGVPDVLIIDAEGCTHEIVSKMCVSNVKAIMVECEHKDMFEGRENFGHVSGLLTLYGFVMTYFAFQYKNQSNSIWIKGGHIVNVSM